MIHFDYSTLWYSFNRVGKTALLERYVTGQFSILYKATIGADFLTKDIELDHHKVVTLQLWDTAGQERFQSLGTSFYRGADCCVLVFDLTIKESFDHLENWRNEFLLHAGIPQNEVNSYPFVVLGNKVDRKEERAVSSKTVEAWCQKRGGIPYIETSAKEGVNVDQGIKSAAELALTHHPLTPEDEEQPQVNLKQTKQIPSGGNTCTC